MSEVNITLAGSAADVSPEEGGRPVVQVGDCAGNAFKLLMRTKEALRLAGATKGVLRKFSLEAGAELVVSLPTCLTPIAVYDRVRGAAAKYIELDYDKKGGAA